MMHYLGDGSRYPNRYDPKWLFKRRPVHSVHSWVIRTLDEESEMQDNFTAATGFIWVGHF